MVHMKNAFQLQNHRYPAMSGYRVTDQSRHEDSEGIKADVRLDGMGVPRQIWADCGT